MKNLIISTIVFLFVSTVLVNGQTNTIYYMGSVPQSYYLNPATQPSCNVFIGVPAVSQVYARGRTSGISITDYYTKDPESDSLITPLHENGDIDAFLNKLEDVETIGVDAGLNILSFGFRVQEMYFSFDATLHSSTSLSVSKDFVDARLKGGFENDRTYNFSEGGFEHIDYSSLSLNISRRFSDDLQIGIRPKVLFGLGTFNTINNRASLYTSTDEWVLDANYEARFAALGVTVPVDEDGIFDPDGEFDIDSTLISPTGYEKILSGNKGFGVDLGAHYMPTQRVQLSLSVLDLGFINWKENTYVAKIDGKFHYRGIDITQNDSIEFAEALIDSLKENLNLTGTNEAFKTTLNPKVIVGGRYFISQGLDLGLLFRADFLPTYIDHDLVFSANWHPHPVIALSGSYSLLNSSYSTFGLGLGINLGPLNIYIVADDVPFKYDIVTNEGAPLPLPVSQHDFNVRFGLNFVFGCNQKKKLRQDKALFNSSDWIL